LSSLQLLPVVTASVNAPASTPSTNQLRIAFIIVSSFAEDRGQVRRVSGL
jgi:hypothetical protein